MNERKDCIIKITKEIAGSKIYIDENTRLYHDLGISGDDMHELLTELHGKFGTSFIEMDFDRYCPNETDGLIEHWLEKLGFGKKWTPLTINHLVQVVRAGSWFDPE